MNEPGQIQKILMEFRCIAVVGISGDKEKPSYYVSKYLKDNGYEIIPVNPKLLEWDGIYAYESLDKLPRAIDVVLIFRKPEFVMEAVEAAIRNEAKAVWMQEGIVNEEAAKLAEEAGLIVIMDRCMMKEHKKLYNRK